MTAIGFDAVSAYARGGSDSLTQPTFAEQCGLIRRERWEKWQALRVPSITFASAGWDTRPRNERPPFWLKDEIKAEPDPTPPAQQKPLIDGVTATPDELAAHVGEAVQWAGTHRDLNPANAILISAWNEHDEGGWLQPTRGADGKPDDSRIHVAQSTGSGRLELAESLLHPEHPLTSRVSVNRVWQWVFGAGLVTTPDDFGRLGDQPSHPELLDWLARDFMRQGWSTKQLVRQLVLSETFRQPPVPDQRRQRVAAVVTPWASVPIRPGVSCGR